MRTVAWWHLGGLLRRVWRRQVGGRACVVGTRCSRGCWDALGWERGGGMEHAAFAACWVMWGYEISLSLAGYTRGSAAAAAAAAATSAAATPAAIVSLVLHGTGAAALCRWRLGGLPVCCIPQPESVQVTGCSGNQPRCRCLQLQAVFEVVANRCCPEWLLQLGPRPSCSLR